MWKITHVLKGLPFIHIQLGEDDEYNPDAEVETVIMHKTGRNITPIGFSDKTHTIFIGDLEETKND